MTGFGAAVHKADGARWSVEVRSVNNRFFKAVMRLPSEFESLEQELESLLMRRLARGSVTVSHGSARTLCGVVTPKRRQQRPVINPVRVGLHTGAE